MVRGLPKRLKLPLTLKQILNGTNVQKTFKRTIYNLNYESGKLIYKEEEKCVIISVSPGTEWGTPFIFPREGDQIMGKYGQQIPADVVFIAEFEQSYCASRDHNFKRVGPHLHYWTKIFKSKFVDGDDIDIPILDDDDVRIPISIKKISLHCDSIERRIPGFGLPYPNKPEKRGDLLVHLEIIPGIL